MHHTCDGVMAARALLGHCALVAVHTICMLLMGGEARFSEGLSAGVAHEAFRVPGLVLVGDSTRGDGLPGRGHDIRQE